MSGIIPKRVLEEIRFNNDIVEVINDSVSLKRAGSAYKACCPFHKEKTPSFHVNPQRQIFHCFGCGAGGDVFGFLMQYEGVDFTTAAKMLAQRAGIKLEFEESSGAAGAGKEVIYRIHQQLGEFYQRCLAQAEQSGPARDYLKKRGLTGEIIEEFKIGYAPGGWNNLEKWAKKYKFSMEDMEVAGVVLRNDKPEAKFRYYDRFRDRIMFPVFDQQGQIIAFSGRMFSGDGKEAKYVNSPETPIFHKSHVLYALDKARRHIVGSDTREAIVCEGQIDVIRCHQAGFKNAVASQGTAFTEDHARILNRFADSVVIAFDSDKAGQDAAIKLAGLFMETGMAVRVALLPGGEDPDSYIIAKGAEAFGNLIKKAISATGFQIEVLSGRENTDSEVGAMRTARAVLGTISRCPSAVQRAKLIQEASERLRIPASALQEDLRVAMQKMARSKEYAERREQAETSAPGDGVPKEERELCEHVVQAVDSPGVISLLRNYLPLEMITSPLCRQVIEASLNSFEQGNGGRDVLIGAENPSDELKRFAAGIQMAPEKLVGDEFSREDAVKDIILMIWRGKLERERTGLPASQIDRRREITYDLKAMRRWETGAPIIEIEMAG